MHRRVLYYKKLSARIDELIKEAMRSPLEGKGKPERLFGDFAGFYSRRIGRDSGYCVNRLDAKISHTAECVLG